MYKVQLWKVIDLISSCVQVKALNEKNMGACGSKGDHKILKRDKNHNRQKMFRFGISFGRNDLNLQGHLQAGYTSETIKNYGPAAVKPTADNRGIRNIAYN